MRALLFDATLPPHFWLEALTTAAFLINRLPSPTIQFQTPNQILYQRSPDDSLLRTFGCACYPLSLHHSHHKLQPRSTPCIFLGYAESSKGYKCFNPTTGKIILSRHTVFDENNFPFSNQQSVSQSTPPKPQSSSLHPLLVTPMATSSYSKLIPTQPPDSTTNASSSNPSDTINSTLPSSPTLPHESSHQPSAPVSSTSQTSRHPMITRTKTGSLKPKAHFNLLHSSSQPTEPTALSQALREANWRQAMFQEFQALQSQGTGS